MNAQHGPQRDAPASRRYNSPLRRQRAAETRERIVGAGSALVHSFPSWHWDDLTFRAVAERAGVSESTVYRHFANERELHDAVMHRLREEAGVSYDGITADELPDVATRVLAALSRFSVARSTSESHDPTFVSVDEQRRRALLGAVTQAAPEWSAYECEVAAAMLDVLWGVPSYERLVAHWDMNTEQATAAIRWAMQRLIDALHDGAPPPQS